MSYILCSRVCFCYDYIVSSYDVPVINLSILLRVASLGLAQWLWRMLIHNFRDILQLQRYPMQQVLHTWPPLCLKGPAKKRRRFKDSKQYMRGVINHACTHFNCDINKPRLTLWHGWVITSPSFMWIYSISQEICTRFCCALLCCGYAIVHNEFTWSVYPYSSGLLCWHWAIVRLPQCQWSKPDGYVKISQCITTTKHSKAKTVCIFLGIYSNS